MNTAGVVQAVALSTVLLALGTLLGMRVHGRVSPRLVLALAAVALVTFVITLAFPSMHVPSTTCPLATVTPSLTTAGVAQYVTLVTGLLALGTLLGMRVDGRVSPSQRDQTRRLVLALVGVALVTCVVTLPFASTNVVVTTICSPG